LNTTTKILQKTNQYPTKIGNHIAMTKYLTRKFLTKQKRLCFVFIFAQNYCRKLCGQNNDKLPKQQLYYVKTNK